MPAKLQTTVAKISTIPNAKNSTLVKEYYEYMIQNGSSERHINNQVKAAIAYSISLGSKRTLCNVRNSKQILEFLDSKVKDQQIDPDKKWITTWNYLHRIKRLFRWLHKQQGKKRNIPEEELKPWADKVKQIRKDPEAKRLRVYFNNHYAGAAVENALKFKEMIGETLTKEQQDAKEKMRQALQNLKNQKRLVDFN